MEQLAGGTPTTLAPSSSRRSKRSRSTASTATTPLTSTSRTGRSAPTPDRSTSRIDFNGGDNNVQDHLLLIGPRRVDNEFRRAAAMTRARAGFTANDRLRIADHAARELVRRRGRPEPRGQGVEDAGPECRPALVGQVGGRSAQQGVPGARPVAEDLGEQSAQAAGRGPSWSSAAVPRTAEESANDLDLPERRRVVPAAPHRDGTRRDSTWTRWPTTAQINSSEALRAALDGLDAMPNNVTFTEASGVTTFNMQVVKSLERARQPGGRQ